MHRHCKTLSDYAGLLAKLTDLHLKFRSFCLFPADMIDDARRSSSLGLKLPSRPTIAGPFDTVGGSCSSVFELPCRCERVLPRSAVNPARPVATPGG